MLAIWKPDSIEVPCSDFFGPEVRKFLSLQIRSVVVLSYTGWPCVCIATALLGSNDELLPRCVLYLSKVLFAWELEALPIRGGINPFSRLFPSQCYPYLGPFTDRNKGLRVVCAIKSTMVFLRLGGASELMAAPSSSSEILPGPVCAPA